MNNASLRNECLTLARHSGVRIGAESHESSAPQNTYIQVKAYAVVQSLLSQYTYFKDTLYYRMATDLGALDSILKRLDHCNYRQTIPMLIVDGRLTTYPSDIRESDVRELLCAVYEGNKFRVFCDSYNPTVAPEHQIHFLEHPWVKLFDLTRHFLSMKSFFFCIEHCSETELHELYTSLRLLPGSDLSLLVQHEVTYKLIWDKQKEYEIGQYKAVVSTLIHLNQKLEMHGQIRGPMIDAVMKDPYIWIDNVGGEELGGRLLQTLDHSSAGSWSEDVSLDGVSEESSSENSSLNDEEQQQTSTSSLIVAPSTTSASSWANTLYTWWNPAPTTLEQQVSKAEPTIDVPQLDL